MLENWNKAHRECDILSAQYNVALDRQRGLLAVKSRAERELDRIPVALELLQALYDRVSGALIGSCETAMTDAVRAIIGDETIIGIEAKCHRNQTKVSIGTALKVNDGTRVLRDIVRDEGGGLTNVVTMILRMIAVGRSGQRRFIILDEPDCFLNPTQITPFFEIIKDMVDKAGFQIVLLTHHTQSMSCFGDDVNIITFSNGGGRVTAYATHENGTPERTDIIHGVHMKNFGKHEDIYIPLTSGLNVITGPSNIGKSRILAALRCVLGGDGSDSVLHTSEPDEETGVVTVAKSCSVIVDFDDDKQVIWKRRKSGSPVEVWDFLYKGAAVTLSDGTLCCGKNGLDWVGRPDCLNMRPISGLWPALHLQKMPVFALEDGAALADLLSISQTSIHLKTMISVASDRKKVAERDLRESRQELDALSKSIHWMNTCLTSLRDTLDIGDAELSAYQARQETIATLTAIKQQYENNVSLMRGGEETLKAVDVAIPKLNDVDCAISLLIDYDDAAFMEWAGTATVQTCEQAQIPSLDSIDEAMRLFAAYTATKVNVDRAEAVCRITNISPVDICDTASVADILAAYRIAGKRAATELVPVPAIPEIEDTSAMQQVHNSYTYALKKAEAPVIAEVVIPDLVDVKGVSEALDRYQTASAQIAYGEKLKNTGAVSIPDIADTSDLLNMLTAHNEAMRMISSGKDKVDVCERDMQAIDASMAAQRNALGMCPICGRL